MTRKAPRKESETVRTSWGRTSSQAAILWGRFIYRVGGGADRLRW